MPRTAVTCSVVPARSNWAVALCAAFIVSLGNAPGFGRAVATQQPAATAQKQPSNPACLEQKVAHEELSLFPIDGVTVPVYLVGQGMSVVLGRPTPIHKAEIIIILKDWFDVVKDAGGKKGAVKRGGFVAQDEALTIRKDALLSVLKKRGQDTYVRTMVVDDTSFEVTVKNTNYSLRVSTHDVKDFADITVCRVS